MILFLILKTIYTLFLQHAFICIFAFYFLVTQDLLGSHLSLSQALLILTLLAAFTYNQNGWRISG